MVERGGVPCGRLTTGYADVERDLCLTVAVAGGASECGDLRLAHALPAIRSLNKVRAPVLLYNSQHARPMPVVAARVMLPVERGTPSSVQAVLLVGANTGDLTARATLNWPGSAWPVGQPRRIALTYDAWYQATGVYRYAVQVTATYPDGSVQRWMMRGSLALVNRRESTFGAGWWLAGLERLQLIEGGVPTSMLWMGGDGSTRVYEPLASAPTSVWVGRTPDRGQDTVWAVSDYPGARYMRRLPGKVRVYFDATGKHIATVNRLDHHTRFTYDASGRLGTLQVPTGAGAGGAGVSYVFAYGAGGPNGRLYSVTAPDLSNRPTRRVVVGPQNGDHRVWTIQDPDQKYVEFAYFDGGRPEVVSRRTDRRRQTGGAHYFFGAAGRLVKVSFDMGEMVNGQYGEADDLTTWLTPTDIIGLDGALHHPDAVHALVDGPRTDVVDATRFWLDRFGSPWRIVDAGQRETLVTRGDTRFPALATRVDGPVGADGGRQTVTAQYDTLGNLKSQTDWSTSRVVGGATLHATTTYERTDRAWPDLVTRVTLPEGEVTRMGYLATGNLEWQQPGHDATRAVRFWYNAAGLADSVGLPVMNGQRAVERFTYDGALNLSAVTTPRNARTAFANDSLGRTWKTESPIDGTNVLRQENTFYSGNDRVEYSRTIAPALSGVAGATPQTVIVLNTYDAEGNPLSVARSSDPDPAGIGWVTTRWGYDAAGRPVAEWAPDATPNIGSDNPVDSTFYDKAGNVVRVRSRRYAEVGDDVTATYDALNRPLMRITPQVRYSAFNQGIAAWGFIDKHEHEAGNPPYPWYQDAGGGYLVRADTARFGYDQVGNLVQADNRDALIRRSYHVNGLLRGDTLRIRTQAELAEGGSFERHVYGLEHTYDLNGRIAELRHPENIAPRMDNGVVHDRVRYAYDPLTGALASVTDLMGNRFSYQYDVRGQLDAAHLPGGIREDFDYDADGNLSLHQVYNGSVSPQRYSYTWLRQSVFEYDLRGKVTFAGSLTGTADTLRSTYSGLGHALSGHTVSRTRDNVGNSVTSRMSDTLRHDALGNLLINKSTSSVPTVDMRAYKDFLYEHGTARLDTANLGRGRIQLYSYDRAGNTIFSTTQIRLVRDSLPLRDQASYYGADGKLRATDTRTVENDADEYSAYTRVFEEYRYDALGRRVWVRARRNCKTGTQPEGECRLSKVRRTVWDGDRELYEIQMPDMALSAEEDTVQVRMGMYGEGARPRIIDPNPFFGRVAYTYAGGVDRPLSITRIGYGDIQDDAGAPLLHRALEPFAVVPIWNERGQPYIGVFADGAGFRCITVSTGSTRCVKVAWPASWFAYSRPDYRAASWNGTLLEDKQDDSGVHYRRNRYYDPTTGRFTQEDPIGLAGGLNVYGFGNGDPVSYSDPYGLCPGVAGTNPFSISDCPRYWIAGALETVSVASSVIRRVGGGLLSLVPGVNDGNDAATAATGYDVLAGRRVAFQGRIVAGAAVIIPILSSHLMRAAADNLLNATPVGSALKSDAEHMGATFMREQAAIHGNHFQITGAGGGTFTLTQMLGEMNGRGGRFEYIVDSGGNLTHQRFVRGGTINGTPNKP